MDKLLCKLCEHQHWKNEACTFPDSIKIPEKKETLAPIVAAEQPGKVCEVCGDQALKEYLVQKKVDRKTYMRRYMREWRADKKRKKDQLGDRA